LSGEPQRDTLWYLMNGAERMGELDERVSTIEESIGTFREFLTDGDKPLVVLVPTLREEIARLSAAMEGMQAAQEKVKAQARSDRVKIILAVLTLIGAALVEWIRR
jgi:hypothetical protein